jgi:hypothetical protein
MGFMERLEIKVRLKSGVEVSLAITDPKQMWEVMQASGIWPVVSRVLGRGAQACSDARMDESSRPR